MTKRDFVVKIANETGLTQVDVANVIQMTLDGLADELVSGGNIELRNFCVFEVVVKAANKVVTRTIRKMKSRSLLILRFDSGPGMNSKPELKTSN